MRIQIKTNKPVKDNDVKALYLLNYALKISSSERMRKANLDFILTGWGFHETEDKV
jgi:hypothetical protein